MNIHPSPLTISRKSSMKTTYVYPMTIALLVGALTLGGCGKTDSSPSTGKPAEKEHADGEHAEGEKHQEKEAGQSGVVKLAPEEMQAAGVKVVAIEEQAISEQLTLTAVIRANQDRIAHMVPRVSGRITRVTGNLGDTVKSGQTLAFIDSIELGEAHSAFLQARSRYDVARADYDRAERLRKDEIIPEKDYLRARGELERARAESQTASEKLRLLGVPQGGTSSVAAASVYPLTSPFAGTIVEKKAVLGELAKTDDSLFTVADLSTVWIEANLFERDLTKVKIGAPAQVAVSAYPGEVFKGRVTYISSTIDKETRAVPARIEVRNADGRLKPEMFASAAIDTGGSVKGLMVPQDAVVLVQGQSTVFVEEHGGFEARAVETTPSNGNNALIKAGIKPGEKVVVAGAYAIKARQLKSQLGSGHGH